MADEMEQIEARLAAYIDGTLPPAQRAEIEAYLKANPAHAKLISELVSLKSAVSSLPREKAPAEVLDTLQSQIERHALLDKDDEDASPLRITRWPAFGSAAAVLLLAAGLGLLVYQVLPKPKTDLAILSATRPGEVSLSDTTVPPAAPPANKPSASPARESIADADLALRRRSATVPASVSGSVTPEAVVAAPIVPSVPDALSSRMAMNTNQAEFGMAQQNTLNNVAPGQIGGGAGGGAGVQNQAFFGSINAPAMVSDPVRVVIVRSDDPALTQNLLIGSLVADKASFELADWPNGPETAPPASLPSINEVIGRLNTDGHLTPADGVAAGTRPVIVRGIGVDRAYALRDTLNGQRPGRQTAEWAGLERAKVSRADSARMADAERTNTSSQPASTRAALPADVGRSPATTVAPSEEAAPLLSEVRFEPMTGVLLDVRYPTSQPTTLPASQPAAEVRMASDLVVLVVARPAPATLPATQPTTTPSLQ